MSTENNPYAAPQVALVDDAAPRTLEGWTAGQLRMLGWLSLVSVLGSLVALGAAFTSGYFDDPLLTLLSQWLSPVTALLGAYLLLRLKQFAEQRFAAEKLTNPVWAVVVLGVLLSGMELVWGDATSELGAPMFIYFGLLCVYGGLLVWMGIRLRQVQNVYPAFNVMAWMNIIGGLMLATVILIILALIPLLGTGVAMALVFFKAANELQQSA